MIGEHFDFSAHDAEAKKIKLPSIKLPSVNILPNASLTINLGKK